MSLWQTAENCEVKFTIALSCLGNERTLPFDWCPEISTSLLNKFQSKPSTEKELISDFGKVLKHMIR